MYTILNKGGGQKMVSFAVAVFVFLKPNLTLVALCALALADSGDVATLDKLARRRRAWKGGNAFSW